MIKKQLLILVILTISLAFHAGCGVRTVSSAENADTTNEAKRASANVNGPKAETKSKSENPTPAGKSQIVRDIKKIDFENYTFNINGERVRLKNGSQVGACKNEEGTTIWSLEKEVIEYGDLDGDNHDEAILTLENYICGANHVNNDAVLIFTLKNGAVTEFAALDYSYDSCEPVKLEECDLNPRPGVSVTYDGKQKAIVVEQFYFTEDDALCCPSVSREIWYQWNGSSFVEVKRGKIKKEEA